MMKRAILFLLTTFFATSLVVAQDKKLLDHYVYDGWKNITGEQLSSDGRFLIYALNPQEGDGHVIVRNLRTNSEDSLSRAERFRLSFDDSHLVYFISVPHDSVRKAQIEGKRLNQLYKDTLAVYSLSTGELEKIPEVQSFKMPERSGRWLAYLHDRDMNGNRSSGNNENAEEEDSSEADGDNEHEITKNDLVLRNLDTGSETIYNHVNDYFFSKHGERLVIHTSLEDSSEVSGIHVVELSDLSLTTIASGMEFSSVTMDSTASQVAFLVKQEDEDDSEESGEDEPVFYALYYWTDGHEQAGKILDQEHTDFPYGWMIPSFSSPRFSDDGSRILFGTAPEPMRRDTSVEKIDMAEVDVWSWTDERLQTQQLVQLRNDQRNTFQAVYFIDDNRYVQLADHEVENVNIPDGGNADFAIGVQNRHYLYRIQWEGSPVLADVYAIEVSTGNRTLIQEGVRATTSLSPDGNYFIWYDFIDQNWFTYHFASGNVVNLTGHLSVPFFNELNDRPTEPGSYGIAGWTKGDENVLLNDRYDIWVFDPSKENGGRMLTAGHGRDNQLVYRIFSFNPDYNYIPRRDIYFRTFNETTKGYHFHRTDLNSNRPPTELWSGDYFAFVPRKARENDTVILRLSTFQQFPDIQITDTRFRNPVMVTRANPQQDDYLWGDVELIDFMSLDGEALQALLFTPENYDASKEYPTMIYFYERSTNGLHNYRAPVPSASIINIPLFVSKGYVVAVPDIVYFEGFPGRGAENSINALAVHLINEGIADRDRIGIQGQSWGGYQVAHLITRTDIYAAAMAGAPVSNMVSAYGGIRWASGLNRQFQYERTQSRIGGTLWERPWLYIENSPIFHADQVATPLLMMHNDADGAVPWYQGIEFFVALKRLNQPVWMLNYNDEAHNLRQRVNRKDLSVRMSQFFDHYLMDVPMPVWMKHGIPAIEKGLHQGFELIED